MRVLVVDDEIDILDLVKVRLLSKGYEVLVAETGQIALEILTKFEIDIVLLDYMMPGMDGLEVFEEIKKISNEIPVIMVTAHGKKKLILKFMRKGGYDLVEKPIIFEDLFFRIEKAIEKSKLRKELQEQKIQFKVDKQVQEILEKKVNEHAKKLQQMQKKLFHLQKMEAIGTLAGGIAHDFNNILMAILGYATLCLNCDLDEGTRTNIELLVTAANRAKKLVKHILTFSSQSDDTKTSVQVSLVVKEIISMLKASMPSTIEICLDYNSDGIVLANPNQIHQVIMNICTNSLHSMPTGGKLIISIDKVKINSCLTDEKIDKEGGNYIRIRIKDTGHGMDEIVLSRIFEPYFTTKEVGKGTGLGLSIVYGIIKNHSGEIIYESEPGKGTTCCVYLPCMNGITKQKRLITSERDKIKYKERILLVDDEKFILNTLKAAFVYCGYKVEAFNSSIQALDRFRESPNDFDIIISDQTMPALTGINLIKIIRQIRHNIPVIIMSGFSEPNNFNVIKSDDIKFVMKPVMVHELNDIIRALVN